jgi:hypothetical protein
MERYPLAYFAKRLNFLKCFFHFEWNNLEFKDLKSHRQLRSIKKLKQIPLTTRVNNLQGPNKLGLFVENIAHVKPT